MTSLYGKNINTKQYFKWNMGDGIIFLGVGGDPIVTGKQIAASGGFVIQTENMQFHVDPGPGALTNLVKCSINPRETTAILVSHAHIGHCNDVNALISAATFSGLDRQAVLIANRTLVDDSDGNVPYLTEFHRGCVERVIVVHEGNKVGINKIEIDVLKTEHKDEFGVGYKFLCPKFTLAYTGDTGYFKGMEELYKDMDILILNVQGPFGYKEKGHLSSDDAVKIIDSVKPKLAILAHFGSKMLKSDPLFIGREIQKRTGVQTIMAKDGMIINPVTSSIGVRQKTLNIYD